ncbi:MAG: type IV secretory system conjugative DNA transfer family protein [Lachnospiraceae bacterium]|nr:type IV secretory system conjugative DNA transfer family protein [Lachnospiraceae bacterium]
MQNKHYIDPNLDSGRFAEPEEIFSDYTQVTYDAETMRATQAAGLGIEIQQNAAGEVTGAVIDGSDSNTIIVSNTGSGKTRRVLSQYILSCIFAMQSFIVHDPKGELYSFFHKLLERMGFAIRVLNLREPMTGDRFNFLQEAARLWQKGKCGRALEIARGIAETLYLPLEDKNDKFWTQTSVNLFLCYFTIAASILNPKHVTLSAIYSIHVQGLERRGSASQMQYYLEQHKNEKCYELGMPSITAPNETRQSIFSVFSNGLVRVILNEDIEDMTTDSTFEVSDFVSEEKPMALFIITRDEAPGVYATVVAAFVDMIYTTLIDLAHSKYHNTLPRTCHFILEEFGNIAQLSNINDMMTASRSRNIRMVLVVQSLCQLHLNYSKEIAEVLIGNSQNLVYMASTDMDLVDMISKRCGHVIDSYTNESRRLLSPERLTHMNKKDGETLFLLDRHYPYISFLPDLSCYKMIESQEHIEVKPRKRLEKCEINFAKIVQELYDRRIKELINQDIEKRKEKRMEDEATKQKMLDVPEKLVLEINRIISSL